MAESSYLGDNQFAGLVEAATAAADQEVVWSHNDSAGGATHQVFEGEEAQGPPASGYPPLHSGQYDPNLRSLTNSRGSGAFAQPQTRKRKRGPDSVGGETPFTEAQAAGQPIPQQSSPDRTLAGVHSAAALFRAPSTTSKKYTRPPMSKLFSSLQLPPEEFLHLQSAAKAYMLDEDHPERRDCVGLRGKTDSDMVKLKLWACVQEFLDQQSNGERFFGTNAPKVDGGDGVRGMTWPEDAQQIIKACIPLMRRMVTNERQRKYAVESRKGGAQGKREEQIGQAKQQEHRPPTATIEEVDNSATFTTENIDIFGDGIIPDPREASEWYEMYNTDAALDKIFVKSGFPRVLFLPMITNIDGHCRLYHGDEGPLCSDSCKTRLVQRLLELPIYQQNSPDKDPYETVQEVFHVVLTHLIISSYWKHRTARSTEIPSATRVTPARRASVARRVSIGNKATEDATEGVTTANAHSSSSSPQLLVHIVRQDKCLLPPFGIPSSDCPSLRALRMQIEKHYDTDTLREKGVTCLLEATLKVWLPDGLVRVVDDGQWMVTLLSAEKVEWMGGEIRVLLEP